MDDTSLDEARTARITFLEYHRPVMPPGHYDIEVQQQVSGPRIATESFTARRTFTVAGDRFTLKPGDVYAVFPPDGSLGDHSQALPHIVLERSTLPWEQRAGGAGTPWLALLLLTEQEAAGPAVRPPLVTTLGELTAPAHGDIEWPGLTLDPQQYHADDKCTVIDIRRSLLETLLPHLDDLSLLTHVRKAEDARGQPVGDERAVVLGSRLPAPGGVSIAHLVSVQDRYANGRFDAGQAPPAGYVRLVSMKSWRFACADPGGDFTGLLTGLDREPSTLRLPRQADAEAERHLAAGSVPLAHHLRPGRSTVSWYRGPLIPCPSPPELTLPAETSAELTRYDPALGLLDVTYAAAWELGRLLTLQSRHLSTSLFDWKRGHAQSARPAGDWLLHPAWAAAEPAATLPSEVVTWFRDLRQLRGVPLHYLVPDQRLLPPESIRFVQLDQVWCDCLLDGAFSLGRLTGRLKPIDRTQHALMVETVPTHPTVTGFLLRSSVVSGWPGLLVDGYSATDQLSPLRQDRPAPDLLLCLFDGDVARVEIHQKPETLHFSPFRLTGHRRTASGVVDLGALVAALRTGTTFTSADFAAHTADGVPRVTFQRLW